jgi:hypothetical protein
MESAESVRLKKNRAECEIFDLHAGSSGSLARVSDKR